MESARENMVSPLPELSPESKKQQRKLHKEAKPPSASAGFRSKIFGRNKNRSSKLPDNAAADVNDMLARQASKEKSAPAPIKAPEPVPEPIAPTPVAVAEPEPELDDELRTPTVLTEGTRTPTAVIPDRSYEPSVEDTISRVDTDDANEAHQEFSRFDQGPLLEQPAFIPDDSDGDDAVPPPIARHVPREPQAVPEVDEGPAPAPNVPSAKPAAPVQPQDRWAQIRKNAAERAAQRQSEEQSRGGYSRTDGEEDTSGEESE